MGHRNGYMLIATIGMSIFNLLLWATPNNFSPTCKFFWILISLLFLETFNTMFSTPYSALGNEIAKNSKAKFSLMFNQRTNSVYRKMKDIFNIQDTFKASGLFESVEVEDINPGTGIVTLNLNCSEETYNQVVEEILGGRVDDKEHFIKTIQNMKQAKETYSKVGDALKLTEQCGYGISIPTIKDMSLSTPELIKQGNRYGIKIKATAPAIHLVQVEVESTFEPIIGSIEQSQALIDHMLEDYEDNPEKVWNSEIFGRKLCDVINDGIYSKTNSLSDETLIKFKEALEKVVNHGHGGVIAVII
jgi:stage IV sporulation protein A